MSATLNFYAPGGIEGVRRFLRAAEAVVAKHGTGERDHNGCLTVPRQGLCGFQDSRANRCTVLADRCRCDVCLEYLDSDRIQVS